MAACFMSTDTFWDSPVLDSQIFPAAIAATVMEDWEATPVLYTEGRIGSEPVSEILSR